MQPNGERRGEGQDVVGQWLAADDDPQDYRPSDQPATGIEWDASEYVHHDKGFIWLFVLGLITAAAAGAAVWFGLWFFAGLIVLMGITFGYYALRPPKTIHYRLVGTTLTIGAKSFDLAEFKSFGVVPEGAFYSIQLIPVKRLAPATIIYFAEEHGEAITDILGAHMPMEEISVDWVDLLMRKLHF